MRAPRQLFVGAFGGRHGNLLAALVIMLVILAVLHPGYFTLDNVRVVALNQSAVGIVSLGMAYLIIVGQVDLSIGSIFVAAAFMGAFLSDSQPAVVAALGGILLGGALGLANGLAVWRIRVSPIIVTLGSLTLIQGIVLVVTQGHGRVVSNEDFIVLGRGTPLGVPTFIWVLACLSVIAHVVLSRTTIGRYIYATGGNAEAAKVAGIHVRRYHLGLFAFTGCLVGLVGVMTAARFASANITYGATFNLDVITAVILGGVAFTGGEGTIIGVIVAVAFLGVVNSGLIALGVDPFYTDMVKGGALITSVLLEQLTQERNERFRKVLAMAEYATIVSEGRHEDQLIKSGETAREPAVDAGPDR
jgi:ribose transport system permease protein